MGVFPLRPSLHETAASVLEAEQEHLGSEPPVEVSPAHSPGSRAWAPSEPMSMCVSVSVPASMSVSE